jgi:hypothetical protein
MMATYKQIQGYIKEICGYTPKTCWIAHAKELYGLNPNIAPNRHAEGIRMHPCPPEKQNYLRNAFIHFGMINE